jgi:PAS fold
MDRNLKMDSLLSHLPAAVYSCECIGSWKMYFISDGITDISGYKPSDFINKDIHTFSIIIHTDDKKMVEEAVFEAVEQRKAFSVEYRILDTENKIHWVLDKGTAKYDEEDKVIWLEGMIIDITDLKAIIEKQDDKIEKLEQHLRNIKLISGRIPLCTKCGKTKDDGEKWIPIEKYIENNSEVIFNHEICPDCKNKLYGDQNWYKDENSR